MATPEKQLPLKYRLLFRVRTVDEMWAKVIIEGDPMVNTFRKLHDLVPDDPRCNSCHTPFAGFGGVLSRAGLFFSPPSQKNPRFCNSCDTFNMKFPGGAEVEMTILFVDVRGSTGLAENMEAMEFSRLMNRFYETTIDVLIHADAFIDKIVGDAVTAHFFPGYAGPEHARRAVEAGREILRVTGHGDAGGAWVPVGVGVHTGLAWVGSIVGAAGVGSDFTALGDNVNIAARLASEAAAGEVFVSEAAWRAGGFSPVGVEERAVDLKGKSEPVVVRVLRIS